MRELPNAEMLAKLKYSLTGNPTFIPISVKRNFDPEYDLIAVLLKYPESRSPDRWSFCFWRSEHKEDMAICLFGRIFPRDPKLWSGFILDVCANLAQVRLTLCLLGVAPNVYSLLGCEE